ncbi:hypothetical protein [Halorientalis regularis]|uniref:Uncharacterized protein n=1 Tax=Halorientalis regularis TaxID=660518 RepID=A0A1G7HV11_9EURY|nr:hypothetical protein [Halorientalis regularis]SDF04173.1 hypothetical protein SAMN05216218_103167 [Halorientalis regularis]
MRRRALLAAARTGCIGFGGCLGDRSDATPDPSTKPTSTTDADPITAAAPTVDSGSTGTFESAEDIGISIANYSEPTRTVTATVTADGATIFEDSATLATRESTMLDPGIDEKGGCELIAETDGGRRDSLPVRIGEYHLEAGSNSVVRIRPEWFSVKIEQ